MSSITEDVVDKFVISLRADTSERRNRRVTVAKHNGATADVKEKKEDDEFCSVLFS